MRILVAGAGVIGTVYGAHLAAAGHAISVLSHPPRTADIAARGLTVRDVLTGSRVEAAAAVVPDAAAGRYDLVLAAVRADQLASACAGLTGLQGAPAVLFFGNNPAGRSAIPATVPGVVQLGFPGIGGVLRDETADYARIRQQPTALQAAGDPRVAELERALRQRGFAFQRVTDMNGWLAYHAAFVACVTAALYRCGGDPARLAADRPVLTLMCDAVTEAFRVLRDSGVSGLPRNLATLHSRALKPVAVRYWARTMRSPDGELYFAAHARHAQPEMRALAGQVTARLGNSPAVGRLNELLLAAPPASR
jgi:2-dehydropantoate 2-reductase